MSPRQARLDVAGTLHHVIARGIERGAIFRDDADREDFVRRLGERAEETKTNIYAWALIPNHFHLLLRSGPEGLSHFMRRLLTGYATSFNRRHKRSGHLFQNRFTSIACEEDSYFTELVRYIHLNPIKAGIVRTMKELDSHPWSGHHGIMGKRIPSWQDATYVLGYFGGSAKAYRAFLQEGVDSSATDFEGGGLTRSSGGTVTDDQRRNPVRTDERVLGTGDFVLSLLKEKPRQAHRGHQDIGEAAERFCGEAGTTLLQIQGSNRARRLSCVRAVIARRLVDETGSSYAEIGRLLGVSGVAVSKMMGRSG